MVEISPSEVRVTLVLISLALACGGMGVEAGAAAADPRRQVVINEIMYHPPEDRDDLQFIEILNAGIAGADLSGWSFAKGVQFRFPPGSSLTAGSSGVVCRNPAAFQAHYGGKIRILGTFQGRLSHSGEYLELQDAQGNLIDQVRYDDRAPWPRGPDGYGSSLERIHPGSVGDAANWLSSAPASRPGAGGTPGQQNSAYSPHLPPRLGGVRFGPAAPAKETVVQADVSDPSGVKTVGLVWWLAGDAAAKTWKQVELRRVSGDDKQGVYAGIIPPQPEGRIVRFTLRAEGASGAVRIGPGAHEPRPTYSFSTHVNTNTSQIPFLQLSTFGALERPAGGRFGRRSPVQDDAASAAPRWSSAALYMAPGSTEVRLFDHVRVRARHGGLKVSFHADDPLTEMTGINLLFEGSPRYVLAEYLAYDLYRKAGVPAPVSEPVRLWLDGRLGGYHLLVEQPNKGFLRRNGRDDSGNLYKILWYEQGVVRQHEKKTNLHTGHDDVVGLVNALNRTSGAAQWELIEKEFNVEEMINYYAVNMCIQNWDGFFNNHYVYHDLKPGGRWEVFPWDEDKTWGDYDGASSKYDWYSMPLTMGMNERGSSARAGNMGFGFGQWMRPPGWFSGPLLANSEFRRRFLLRLEEICREIFTPERMGPAINLLENRLADEVILRSRLTRENPDTALRSFRSDIESFRNQVIHRRNFIQRELARGNP